MALQIGYIVLAVLGLILSILPEMGGRLPVIERFKQRLGNQAGWVLNLISLIGTLFLVIGILGFIVLRFVPSFELSSGIKFEDREYITLFGGLQLRYYGIVIVVAMLIAASVATRLAKQDRRDPEHVWGILTWAIIPGIILARSWFVTFPPRSVVVEGFDALDYWSNFFAADGAIAIWTGGLSIFGRYWAGTGCARLHASQLFSGASLARHCRGGFATGAGDWSLGKLHQPRVRMVSPPRFPGDSH
ncbi:MAG UNVERIFIED_CONTAM: prolipoprotein diacylglyceryl transferase [Anaerolineae bacterium]|jgi:hypothetical protein